MSAPKCPFQNPIIVGDFACRLGLSVTVRNAPQIHCQSEQALETCKRLYEHLKDVGLAALDMQDDLTTTPHSAYLKIQYGGLLGLQNMYEAIPTSVTTISDIHDLVSRVTENGTRTDELDYQKLSPVIKQQRLKRRR